MKTSISPSPATATDQFQEYFQNVAHARFVIRKVFRIVDEQAKREGLDSVHHQVLIQIFGAAEPPLTVTQVAELVDIAPAFASRIIKNLEQLGFVERITSQQDRRVTLTRATESGSKILASIDQAVAIHVEYFQAQLGEQAKQSAMSTFAFYVGLEDNSVVHPIRHHNRPA